MAEKKQKSHAEKAASAKKHSGNRKTYVKKPKDVKDSKTKNNQETKTTIPVRVITSAVCLVLFILFLVIFLNPEGILIAFFKGFLLGLIGQIGFYVSIPALLYLFVIQAFSSNRPIIMRSVCLIVFIFLCGCISQLTLPVDNLPQGAAIVVSLFEGGSTGATAGLLCGGIALLIKGLCGWVISFLIFVVAAVFTLLASFQITIPSIIRAVQKRPRAEWEDEEQEEVPEPAAVLVNHLANRRIEYLEKRRNARELAESDSTESAQNESTSVAVERPANKHVDDFMSQIDSDVEKPVAVAEQAVSENADVDLILPEKKKLPDNTIDMSDIRKEMLPFKKTEEVIPSEKDIADTKKEKVSAKDAEESAALVAAEIAQSETAIPVVYAFPPIDLLNRSGETSGDGTMEMRENTRRLNETLASFKIEAKIINVTRGPSVTRYEAELAKGVKLNKLTTCADDIALSLGASGVRIAAVQGKISVVGIEVPNRAVTTVSLREVIDSNEFNRAKSKSSFAVGKDIGGSCIVGNIAKLPHMLIAGTTGSGKSVCMNSIIISLLYKASPDDVKLIMVDPKMVELGIYNGIPHLMIPVVTDPKKAAGSLQWAVTEMMRRYKAMSDVGVRDLESYNTLVEEEGEGTRLPQIVVIIDELADLMLVAAKEVEESICRIAQMGRAAGIHLIIATQRPSADVITGLMKANIPSRIAFAVASAMESRIILDNPGAEKLVGKGDMLYYPIGTSKPLRVQGCFVSDSEVEAVATYVKSNFTTNYDQGVMEEIEKKAQQTGSGKATASEPEPSADELDGDEMLPAAVDVILETGQASVSMLQRRLKLGYARAARIVDEMEEKGIVGPFQGSKPRSILITKEQWQVMKSGQNAQLGFDDLDDSNGDVPEEIF